MVNLYSPRVNMNNVISSLNLCYVSTENYLFAIFQYRHFLFNVCVCYISASLYFKSKREYLSKQQQCFPFHFKTSFRSRENQILEFYVFKFHDVIKCLSIKQEINFMNNLGSKHSLLMKFRQFVSILQKKTLIEKFYKNCGLKTSPRPFRVCKELSIAFFWTYKSNYKKCSGRKL